MLQQFRTEGARILHDKLQEHGREIASIGPGCILVTLICPTLHSLSDLKETCESGELALLCETALLEDGLQEKFGLRDIRLKADISEWEYKLCKAELEQGKLMPAVLQHGPVQIIEVWCLAFPYHCNSAIMHHGIFTTYFSVQVWEDGWMHVSKRQSHHSYVLCCYIINLI